MWIVTSLYESYEASHMMSCKLLSQSFGSPWHKVCPLSSLWHRAYHLRVPTLFLSCQPDVFVRKHHTLEATLSIRCVQEDDRHLLLSNCWSHPCPERDFVGRKQSSRASMKKSVLKAALKHEHDCRDLTIGEIFRLHGSNVWKQKAFFPYWIFGWRDTVIWNVIVSLADIKDLKSKAGLWFSLTQPAKTLHVL